MNRSVEQLTAADIMQTHVVATTPEESLQEALASMTEHHVTGLPVLDRRDQCVGVITASDILSYEQDHAEESEQANADMARHFDPETQRWETIRVTAFALEEFADIPVSELMTRELVAVEAGTSIRDVAVKMSDAEVHRILVLNDNRQLLGIISAVDFVRLFAEA